MTNQCKSSSIDPRAMSEMTKGGGGEEVDESVGKGKKGGEWCVDRLITQRSAFFVSSLLVERERQMVRPIVGYGVMRLSRR